MKCGERVKLIEEHIRLIQQKWSDLKSEVAHLDRRRRRARRKEREGTSTIAVLVGRVALNSSVHVTPKIRMVCNV